MRAIHTCDNYFSTTPVSAALVLASTDVNAGVTRLDTAEVQLCSCAHTHTEISNMCQIHTLHINIPAYDRISTLSASLGTAGDEPPIFSRPEEVVWGVAGHLTLQSNRAALGHLDPGWMNLHHKGGCS